MYCFSVHACERQQVCFLSDLPINMHVFARSELAELQTVRRRSVRLTVVGAVWLDELLPHGFSKRSWSKPSLAHKPSHPLWLPHTQETNKRIDEVTDKTERLTSALGTSRKMTPTCLTDSPTRAAPHTRAHTHRETAWKSSSQQILRQGDRQREGEKTRMNSW